MAGSKGFESHLETGMEEASWWRGGKAPAIRAAMVQDLEAEGETRG